MMEQAVAGKRGSALDKLHALMLANATRSLRKCRGEAKPLVEMNIALFLLPGEERREVGPRRQDRVGLTKVFCQKSRVYAQSMYCSLHISLSKAIQEKYRYKITG